MTGVPRDARTIESILRAMGVEDADPAVTRQLLALLHRHVAAVLLDARAYADHADKPALDLDDVRLAIRARSDTSFAQPPPRDTAMRLARECNARPLPPVDCAPGVALPPPAHQLTAQNYRVELPDTPLPPALAVRAARRPLHSSPPTGMRMPLGQADPTGGDTTVSFAPSLPSGSAKPAVSTIPTLPSSFATPAVATVPPAPLPSSAVFPSVASTPASTVASQFAGPLPSSTAIPDVTGKSSPVLLTSVVPALPHGSLPAVAVTPLVAPMAALSPVVPVAPQSVPPSVSAAIVGLPSAQYPPVAVSIAQPVVIPTPAQVLPGVAPVVVPTPAQVPPAVAAAAAAAAAATTLPGSAPVSTAGAPTPAGLPRGQTPNPP